MNSAAEIWERVLSILKQNMTETTISTWFSDSFISILTNLSRSSSTPE